MLSAEDLLAAYDAKLRADVPDPLPAGEVAERDGPLVRIHGGPVGGWILYRDLGEIGRASCRERV